MSERPAKRLKTSATNDDVVDSHSNGQKPKERKLKNQWRQQFHSQKHPEKGEGQSNTSGGQRRPAHIDGAHKASIPRHSTKTFSQPSVMRSGDKGIFVTCNRGVEKKCLLELLDLVQSYSQDGAQKSEHRSHANALTGEPGLSEGSPVNGSTQDIENDIQAELASLHSPHTQNAGHAVSSPQIDLITLDVPCVSFLRLPSSNAMDPVALTQQICMDAALNPSRPRSRFIRRLTPISSLQKVLNNGLETLCEEILPQYFQISDKEQTEPIEYAIRPTIRNNDKLNRDQIIQTVAERVTQLGKGRHKVNLKYYQLGIVVEVYRTWIGMSVVENMRAEKEKRDEIYKGYEELKRYNLAEIYGTGDS